MLPKQSPHGDCILTVHEHHRLLELDAHLVGDPCDETVHIL
jgi:hypothetical protein